MQSGKIMTRYLYVRKFYFTYFILRKKYISYMIYGLLGRFSGKLGVSILCDCLLLTLILLYLKDSVKEPNISIFFFPPITQWCSNSDVLYTGGLGGECQILVF